MCPELTRGLILAMLAIKKFNWWSIINAAFGLAEPLLGYML